MTRSIIFSFLFFISLTITEAQAVFDIDVDELYVDDDDLIFGTKGELRSYICDSYFHQVRDYDHRIYLYCEDEIDGRDELVRLNLDDFLHFSEPAAFLEWLEDMYFISEPQTRRNDFRYRYVMTLANPSFFAHAEELQYGDGDEWRREGWQLLNLCFLRMNSGFIFLALLSEDASVEAFILPAKKEGLILSTRSKFRGERKHEDVVRFNHLFQSQEYYRIKKVDGGFALFDKLFQERLIDHVYDSIVMSNNIIMGYDPDQVHLYNVLLEPIPVKHVQAAYDEGMRVQILADDLLYWYTPDGVLHDTMPQIVYGVCGNSSYAERKLHIETGRIDEIRNTGVIGFFDNTDSLTLIEGYRITDLTYLNGTHILEYGEYSDLGAIKMLPYNYYIFESPGSKGIIEITVWSDTLKRAYRNKLFHLDPREMVDSVYRLMKMVQPDISTEVLFEHQNIEFFPSDYRHPVKYRIGDLYGYFPSHKEPYYTKLSDFDIAFARYVKRDGSKGWIDIDGREYPYLK